MAALVLLIFPLIALWTPALAAINREFYYVGLDKNWTEAQAYCREKFHDLATVENAEEWAKVKELIADSGDTWYMWFGLYDDLKEWRWSLDDTYLYQNGNTDLESWFVFYVDNLDNIEHCVSINQTGFSDLDCATKLNFVCYDEPSDSHTAVTTPMSWQSAQSYCRQSHTDLASIRSQQEMDTIRGLTDSSEWWVGLFREGWKWADNTQSSFRDWVPYEPWGYPESCGTIDADGWYDATCNWERAFICSAPQKKVLKVTLKTDGSVNLNDPLVQQAILKQMEQDLRGQGVHQDLRLSWRVQPHGEVFNKTH